jgi:hypothetical protein
MPTEAVVEEEEVKEGEGELVRVAVRVDVEVAVGEGGAERVEDGEGADEAVAMRVPALVPLKVGHAVYEVEGGNTPERVAFEEGVRNPEALGEHVRVGVVLAEALGAGLRVVVGEVVVKALPRPLRVCAMGDGVVPPEALSEGGAGAVPEGAPPEGVPGREPPMEAEKPRVAMGDSVRDAVRDTVGMAGAVAALVGVPPMGLADGPGAPDCAAVRDGVGASLPETVPAGGETETLGLPLVVSVNATTDSEGVAAPVPEGRKEGRPVGEEMAVGEGAPLPLFVGGSDLEGSAEAEGADCVGGAEAGAVREPPPVREALGEGWGQGEASPVGVPIPAVSLSAEEGDAGTAVLEGRPPVDEGSGERVELEEPEPPPLKDDDPE